MIEFIKPKQITPEQIEKVDAFGKKLGAWLNEQEADWDIISTVLLVTLAIAISDRSPDKQSLDRLVMSVQHDLWLQAEDRWKRTREKSKAN